MTDIISRNAWGAKPWVNTPRTIAASQRTEFFIHYHGGRPRNDRGDANAKEIEAIHLANGWSGVGYSFIVGQDGAIREGRGWNLQGAHCPGHNVTGWAAYGAIGGDQEPSDAMLTSMRWLYDEGCRRAGRTLAKKGHRDGIATSCPGENLYRWVKAGMPAPKSTPPIPITPTSEEDDMYSDADRTRDIQAAKDAAAAKLDANYAHVHAKRASAKADANAAALTAVGTSLGPTVQKAVEDALAAEYDVDITLTPKETP